MKYWKKTDNTDYIEELDSKDKAAIRFLKSQPCGAKQFECHEITQQIARRAI